MLISGEEQREFAVSGALCLRGIFDDKWLEKVERGIAAILSSPSPYSEALRGEEGDGVYFNDYLNWTRIPEIKDYVYHSPAAEIAGRLMNSQIATFYHEHVLTKEPRTMKKTPWHQDQPYYPFDGHKACSIWMPIDAVSKEATLHFVKGSHQWGRWFLPRKFKTDREYEIANNSHLDKTFEEVPNIDGSHEIISWELERGDCVVFHMMTLHSAADNASDTSHRRVLSTRWFGDDIVFAPRPWITSPPITGGLTPADPPYFSELFPIIWKKN